MNFFDHSINLVLAAILIIGGYQIYFIPQNSKIREPKIFPHQIEDRIPFFPSWVWVYSGLYYPMILFTVFTFDNYRDFNLAAFNYLELLAIQFLIFYLFPVEIPSHWREFRAENSISSKMLNFVWSIDGRGNCFPSMHVSVATLTAMYLYNNTQQSVGLVAATSVMFPVLIGLSTLFTKQHYIIDIPSGAIIGFITFEIRPV